MNIAIALTPGAEIKDFVTKQNCLADKEEL
jgi:hypothetical protein